MDKTKQQKPKPKQPCAKAKALVVPANKSCGKGKGGGPTKQLARRGPSAPSRTSLPAEPGPRCQKRFEQLIHKHQIKNEQLERREDHLLHRLEMLQCSMPVMLAQVCQQPDALLQLLERQFSNDGDDNACVRITPSRHYDCRVREIEAQRKEACRRAEEARALWQEREAALQSQKALVELARQQQQERRQRVEQLTSEARKLQQQSNDEGKKDWLSGSEVSLCSSDLDCLRQLEVLAEVESCKRRQVSELEAQNEMYMRVLARAEEMQQPAASQADELCKQLEACKAELAKYRDVKKSEVAVGQAGAKVCHKDAQAVPKCVSRKSSARIQSAKPPSSERACEAQVQALSKITWAGAETSSKESEARVESQQACVGRYYSEASKSVLARPEACDKKSQARAKVATLASGADVSQLTEPSKCECGSSEQSDNNLLDSNTSCGQGLSKKASLQKSPSTAAMEKGMLKISRTEIETCMSIVNDIYEKLAGTPKFPNVCKDFQNLKNIFASSLGLDIHATLEKQADRFDKGRKKQEVCDGASFAVGRDIEKKQRMDHSAALTCECGQGSPQRVASMTKKLRGTKDTTTVKCKEDRETEKCADIGLTRKSEKGRQDNVDALICKCEPEEQLQQYEPTTYMSVLSSKKEKLTEKCDRAVTTDKEDKRKPKDDCPPMCKDVKGKLKVEEFGDTICKDEKKKKPCNVIAPSGKCELLQQKDDATCQTSKIDKQKCAGTVLTEKEEQRKHKGDVEATTIYKSEKQKIRDDDDAAQKCKEEKRKCNDIVAALASNKGKQPEHIAAPAMKCKKGKQKDDIDARLEKDRARAEAVRKCEEEKRKKWEDTKAAKLKLKDSQTALVTKKEKIKTKVAADAASIGKVDKEKPKGKKEEQKISTHSDIVGTKPPKTPSSGKRETISRAKSILCCEDIGAAKMDKIAQRSPCDVNNKRKLASPVSEPCGSDKKPARKCESKNRQKGPLKPCKSDKKPARPCQNRKKESGRKQSTLSLRSVRVSSVEASDKDLSRHDPEEEQEGVETRSKTGSEQARGESLNQLNPTENAEAHEPDDKQPCGCLETGVCSMTEKTKEASSVEGESEYFECSCDFLACLDAVRLYSTQTRDKPTADKTPLEELCLCGEPEQPLLDIVDKWRREAAPGKLYCGYPHQQQRGRRHQQALIGRRAAPNEIQRRRCGRRRRHHPYKRTTTSSSCLGWPRRRFGEKCTCSGLLLPSSPSVCGLDKQTARPGERCRRCGARISASAASALLLAHGEQQRQSISQRSRSSSDVASHSEETIDGKRDQGVLAKLPKPKRDPEAAHRHRGNKKKRCPSTECCECPPLELGTSRKTAARMLDMISSDAVVVVGPSCTCLTNHCDCAALG